MTPATELALTVILVAIVLLNGLSAGIATYASLRSLRHARRSALAMLSAEDFARDAQQYRDETRAATEVIPFPGV
jgi:hypothetical protein